MKNTSKKLLTIVAATAILASMGITSQAEEKPENLTIAPNPAEKVEEGIYINGDLLEGAQIKTENEKTFIPLRAVCESLNFKVDWDNDTRSIVIENLPVYITCSPDRDGYTFAKTAPMLLGADPLLIDDTTYVPTNFVDEILKGTIKADKNVLYIEYGEEEGSAIEENIITGKVFDLIKEEDKLVSIVIGDEDPNTQTIIHISDEVLESVKALNLEKGMDITVTTTNTQTMSIPPQVTATKVELAKATDEASKEEEKVEVEAKIVELVYEDEKLVQIVTGDEKDPMKQIVFNVSDEIAEKAAELKLEKGKTIKGIASPMMTRSIPAQQPLFSISEVK